MRGRLAQDPAGEVFFWAGMLRVSASMSASPAAPAPETNLVTLPLAARVMRAAGLALAWALGALPAVLGVPRCPSARWLHVPCPGCGMQRAAHLFLHGDFAASIAMNPLAIPIALSALAVAAATVLLTLTRGSPMALLEWRPARVAVIAFVALEALSVVLWALRFVGLFGGPVGV